MTDYEVVTGLIRLAALPGDAHTAISPLNSTFSSALVNAISSKRENGAILIGEATGGKPNGYGEVRSFNLPNVGLSVSYSVKFFRSWPDGDPESPFPDVTAAVSSTDYREGGDPAMSAAATRLGLPNTPGAPANPSM